MVKEHLQQEIATTIRKKSFYRRKSQEKVDRRIKRKKYIRMYNRIYNIYQRNKWNLLKMEKARQTDNNLTEPNRTESKYFKKPISKFQFRKKSTILLTSVSMIFSMYSTVRNWGRPVMGQGTSSVRRTIFSSSIFSRSRITTAPSLDLMAIFGNTICFACFVKGERKTQY